MVRYWREPRIIGEVTYRDAIEETAAVSSLAPIVCASMVRTLATRVPQKTSYATSTVPRCSSLNIAKLAVRQV